MASDAYDTSAELKKTFPKEWSPTTAAQQATWIDNGAIEVTN